MPAAEQCRGSTIPGRNRKQSGLSLVELMISLVISSMVTLGLIQMFSANQETSDLLRGQATLAENGRFAMEMIGRSLRKANYRGCNSKREIDIRIDDVPYEFALTNGIQGYEGQGGGAWSPDFTVTGAPTTDGATDSNVFAPGGESGTGIDLQSIVAGTDVITVWFASSTEYRVDIAGRAITSGAENILLEASTAEINDETGAGIDDIAVHHIVLINDCATEDMIVITDIFDTSGQADLEHVANEGTSNATNFGGTAGTGAGFMSGAVVQPIRSHTFYVGTSENVNEFGDPIFSLYRKQGIDAPVELVEGIEDMQILYGVDTGGEALVPNTYITADLVSDYRDVVAVRIQLTASSIDDVGSSAADGILRRDFTQTIRLRNRLKKE